MHEITHILSFIDYKWIIAATVVCILKMWVTVARWNCFIVSAKQLSSTNSFHFYAIGTMINMTLPFRMGDLVRSNLIAEALKIPNPKALGTIATEHILDFIALGFLLVGCLIFYSYHWPARVIPIMSVFFTIITTFFIGCILFKKNKHIQQQIKNFINNILPKRFLFIPNMITNFCGGIFQFGNLLNTLKIVGMTAGVWFAQGIWIYTLLYALGIVDLYHLGTEAVYVLIVMTGVATMIPASPGYIGTFHLMIVLGLTQMGVPKAMALSCAILAHAHAIFTAVLIGCYSLWKGKIKLSLNFYSEQTPTVVQEAV
jgi:uncharacterized protein (TIRG00374 family)